MKQRIAVVVGTRPEVIKMAPVILALKAEPSLETVVVASGQHQEMVQQALDIFRIEPDHNLSVMRPGQTLSGVATAVISGFDALIEKLAPSRIIVHGDTTTAMAASITAFHRGTAVGHVEAGLRTGSLARPYPEEFNRRCIDLVADLLWAPTELARDNLLAERLPEGKRVLVTGNTVVDALQWAASQLESNTALRAEVESGLPKLDPAKRMVLVTGHRRESFGEGFENICQALRTLAARSDLEIVYPVHLNPNVSGPVRTVLGGIGNVHLIAPQPYLAFVDLMTRCDVILTDSGGVQEEAPSLKKPVLVMRDVTERPEAVAAGTARLVGTSRDAIVTGVSLLLDDAREMSRMTTAENPYGDGQAGARIVQSLLPG
ncbi:MAG TPA: UDP-N-acetylglucosamine 2-epimerase (non-hydrolyzing) [Rhizomicrobium sp.]|nr:UDP-N-acetylglucosamine 2-epimerase (non-hydrolyzing) [Rhizomicrobium sp.]